MKKILLFLFLHLTFLNLFAQETDTIFDLYMTAETDNGELQSPINIPSFSANFKNISIINLLEHLLLPPDVIILTWRHL